MNLAGKTILVTGAARRVGREMALAIGRAGGDVVVHHSQSPREASQVVSEVQRMGGKAWALQADFSAPRQAIGLLEAAWRLAPLDGLVNNAAIFEPLGWQDSSLEAWQRHLDINLTAPFLLCQAFARLLPSEQAGRIINILDWRALRPGADHLPYTISKAGLAALTRSLAEALAPRIAVNGIALGAILPPADGADSAGILAQVPARRWAKMEEVTETLLFLLGGPGYITGEVIHVDGGRHII